MGYQKTTDHTNKHSRNRHSSPRPGKRPRFLLLFLLFVGFILIGGVLWLSTCSLEIAPKVYESTVTIEINLPPVSSLDLEDQSVPPSRAQIFKTECEMIRSREVLDRTIDALGLETSWKLDRPSARTKLKNMISVEDVKDTNRLKITVRGKDPQVTSRIAGAVANAYSEVRRNLHLKWAKEAIRTLDKKIAEQEKKVEEKRKILEEIVKKAKHAPESPPNPPDKSK